MRWADLSFDPPARTLRQFAGLWLGILGAVAVWQGVVRERPLAATILGALAVAGGGAGLIWPKAIRPLFVGLTVATFPIGWVVTRVLLWLLFFGLFTPVALVFRLIGRDALHRRRDPARESYWMPKAAPADVRSYFRLS